MLYRKIYITKCRRRNSVCEGLLSELSAVLRAELIGAISALQRGVAVLPESLRESGEKPAKKFMPCRMSNAAGLRSQSSTQSTSAITRPIRREKYIFRIFDMGCFAKEISLPKNSIGS